MKGTCYHCGRENTELHKGLCNKHYRQLVEKGKFLDNNPRSKRDPNEFIYDPVYNCYHIVLYDGNGNPINEALISVEDYEKCKNVKWGIRNRESNRCFGSTPNGRITLGRYILGLSNDDERIVLSINGNPLDNRRDNIFVGTRTMQTIISSYTKEDRNEVVGVRYVENKKWWEVTIVENGEQKFLGAYKDQMEAIHIRRMAETYLDYKNIVRCRIFPLEYNLPDGYNLVYERRTIFTPNEFIFHPEYGTCEIILYNIKCEPVASTLIDIEDYEKCKNIKWHLEQSGYVSGTLNGSYVLLHRYIMNCPPDKEIDHFDRNPLNNIKDNLKYANRRDNLINRNNKKKDKDLPTGVTEENGKYRARYYEDNQNISIGTFNDKIDAIVARKQYEYVSGYYKKKKNPLLYIPDNMYNK